MAGVKISALPAIVTPAASDVFPVVQAGVTYKETVTQLGSLVLLLSGGTLTGNLILNADPTVALGAATKQYVDSVATGLTVQAPCVCATTAALTATYSNGVSGVGATLTNAGAMAAFSVDGISPTAGQRVLIKDQASAFQNGIYTVTTVGSGAVNWVLTRATDFDQPAEIQAGDYVLVLSGTLNGSTSWVQTATVVTIGVDSIIWNQFAADINTVITNIQNSAYNYAEDTGAADAYVATLNPAITAYVEGLLVILDPDNANTLTNPTINVNGLGVKTITNNLGGALVAGDIVASQRIYLLYDGTNFRLLNRNYEKRIQNESFNYVLDTGAADAYVATLVPAVTAYIAGQRISLKIANTNTTTSTVNVNALGVKTIVTRQGGNLQAGDLIAGDIADLRYDGTNFILLDRNYEKRVQSESFNYILDTGAADAYVATLVPAATAYSTGMRLSLKVANTNTTTSTVNVNGLGAKTIVTRQGGNMLAGDMLAGDIFDLRYDGTNFILLNRNIEKRIQNESFSYVLDSGSADAYVATLVPAVTAYTAGQRFSVKIANANTGASTLNVNSLGVQAIKRLDGTALAASDLLAGMIADFRYDGTNFQLLNPAKQVLGTATNNNAPTGYVGEYISSSVLVGSAVSLTTGVTADITSISLTAGDWDVSGSFATNPNAATTTSIISSSISQVSATPPTIGTGNNRVIVGAPASAGQNYIVCVGTLRISLAATTTIYLLGRVDFAINTMGGYGFIGARRVR